MQSEYKYTIVSQLLILSLEKKLAMLQNLLYFMPSGMGIRHGRNDYLMLEVLDTLAWFGPCDLVGPPFIVPPGNPSLHGNRLCELKYIFSIGNLIFR